MSYQHPSPFQTPSNSPAKFPTELVLHCFSFLELKSLIASQGVCQEWRRLVPLAELDPARRRLLDLYHTVINSPLFIKMNSPGFHFTPFDRQAYVDCLLSQYHKIPHEFRLWILEWPSRAVIASLWPALPLEDCMTDTCTKRSGANWIAFTPPQLSAVIYGSFSRFETREREFIPGLLTWSVNGETTWIVFDERPDLFGRVFSLFEEPHFIDVGLQHLMEEEGPDNGAGLVYPDWITYLSEFWAWFEHSRKIDGDPSPSSVPIDTSKLAYRFTYNYREIPVPPWIRRHEAQFQPHLLRRFYY